MICSTVSAYHVELNKLRSIYWLQRIPFWIFWQNC